MFLYKINKNTKNSNKK